MRNTHNLPPEPEPWQVLTDAPEAPLWAWGDVPADELEGEFEAAPTSHEPDGFDDRGDFDDREDLDDGDREPRTADAATWVARGIVVLTIGLLAVLGGLFLGMSVSDPTATATPTPTSPPTSSTMAEEETAEGVIETQTQAPTLRISAAVPDATSGTTRTASATASVASRPPATAEPSPTSSSTPRGKSTNSGKPRPTKTN